VIPANHQRHRSGFFSSPCGGAGGPGGCHLRGTHSVSRIRVAMDRLDGPFAINSLQMNNTKPFLDDVCHYGSTYESPCHTSSTCIELLTPILARVPSRRWGPSRVRSDSGCAACRASLTQPQSVRRMELLNVLNTSEMESPVMSPYGNAGDAVRVCGVGQ